VRVTHDTSIDAAYISFKDIAAGEAALQHVVDAPEAQGQIILDFNGDGQLLGIEVLGATRALPDELLRQAEPP
jgi:uncharacterized protein YuzE